MGLTGRNPHNDRLRLAAVVDDRRARVASYKVRGFSIPQTRVALTRDGFVNPRTGKPWSYGILQADIAFLDAHWKEAAKVNYAEWKAGALEKIDQVEREAWEGWKRSIGKKQQTYTERKEGVKGGGKASVRTEDLAGDPRFLATILDCQKRRAELLGLDAPQRHEHTGRDGGPIETMAKTDLSALQDDELDQVEALLARAAERAGRLPSES